MSRRTDMLVAEGKLHVQEVLAGRDDVAELLAQAGRAEQDPDGAGLASVQVDSPPCPGDPDAVPTDALTRVVDQDADHRLTAAERADPSVAAIVEHQLAVAVVPGPDRSSVDFQAQPQPVYVGALKWLWAARRMGGAGGRGS